MKSRQVLPDMDNPVPAIGHQVHMWLGFASGQKKEGGSPLGIGPDLVSGIGKDSLS